MMYVCTVYMYLFIYTVHLVKQLKLLCVGLCIVHQEEAKNGIYDTCMYVCMYVCMHVLIVI